MQKAFTVDGSIVRFIEDGEKQLDWAEQLDACYPGGTISDIFFKKSRADFARIGIVKRQQIVGIDFSGQLLHERSALINQAVFFTTGNIIVKRCVNGVFMNKLPGYVSLPFSKKISATANLPPGMKLRQCSKRIKTASFHCAKNTSIN